MKFRARIIELDWPNDGYFYHYEVIQDEFPRRCWDGKATSIEDAEMKIINAARWIIVKEGPRYDKSWEFEL